MKQRPHPIKFAITKVRLEISTHNSALKIYYIMARGTKMRMPKKVKYCKSINEVQINIKAEDDDKYS